MQQVTSTELGRKLGEIISQAKRSPVTVTSHGREEVVICDAEYFNRLKQYDTRKALYPHELGPEWDEVFERGYQGEETPHLDHLLDK